MIILCFSCYLCFLSAAIFTVGYCSTFLKLKWIFQLLVIALKVFCINKKNYFNLKILIKKIFFVYSQLSENIFCVINIYFLSICINFIFLFWKAEVESLSIKLKKKEVGRGFSFKIEGRGSVTLYQVALENCSSLIENFE